MSDFDEAQHSRDEAGKFSGVGGGVAKKQQDALTKLGRAKAGQPPALKIEKDTRDYAERMARDKLDTKWAMQSMTGAPKVAGQEHLVHTYISGYRPLPIGTKLPEGASVQHTNGGTRSVIRTAEPLDPNLVAKMELTPFAGASRGHFLWHSLSDGKTLELSKDGGERALLIFKNPRGIWQASDFKYGLGPTGHLEDKTPEALTWETVSGGGWNVSPGAVDDIMASVADAKKEG